MTGRFALTLAAVGLMGCSTDGAEQPHSEPADVDSMAEAAFPADGAVDFVTYADQLSVFSVVAERRQQRGGVETDDLPRLVTIRVERNLWLGPRADSGAALAEGDEVELATWGPIGTTDDDTIRFGEPLLAVGERYVGGLLMSTGSFGIYPGSVAVSNGESVTLGEDGWMFAVGRGDATATINRLVDEVAAASPDPRIADTGMTREAFFALDPWERVLALARTTSTNPGV